MNRHCFPPSLDVRYAVGPITFLPHNTCAEVLGKVRLMHQAFAPALDQDEAVKGIDGDAVGLLEDRGEREGPHPKRLQAD
jgi:hypothetical protein